MSRLQLLAQSIETPICSLVGMSITRVICYPGIESKIFNYPGTRVPDSGNTIFQKIANFSFKQWNFAEKFIIRKKLEKKKYKSRLRNAFRSVFLENQVIKSFFFPKTEEIWMEKICKKMSNLKHYTTLSLHKIQTVRQKSKQLIEEFFDFTSIYQKKVTPEQPFDTLTRNALRCSHTQSHFFGAKFEGKFLQQTNFRWKS
jgi:hypothetical protein